MANSVDPGSALFAYSISSDTLRYNILGHLLYCNYIVLYRPLFNEEILTFF